MTLSFTDSFTLRLQNSGHGGVGDPERNRRIDVRQSLGTGSLHTSDDTPEPSAAETSPQRVSVALGGRTVHRPSPDGTGTACETVAAQWETVPVDDVPQSYRACSYEECAPYLAEVDVTTDDTPESPAWLTDYDCPVVTAPGGDALHRPDTDSPEPAAACRAHTPSNAWRVIELAETATAFYTPCSLDTCRAYLDDSEAFSGSETR